jgi:hypothetical protein
MHLARNSEGKKKLKLTLRQMVRRDEREKCGTCHNLLPPPVKMGVSERMWHVPHSLRMTASPNPVIENGANCGKSGHRFGTISDDRIFHRPGESSGFPVSQDGRISRVSGWAKVCPLTVDLMAG